MSPAFSNIYPYKVYVWINAQVVSVGINITKDGVIYTNYTVVG